MATALDINDTADAHSLLKALESEPPSAATYVGQGRWSLNQGDLVKANSSLQNALVFDPDSAEALHWLAVVERRNGDNAAAKAHAEQALRANPKFLPALEDQMLLAADRKDFRDAVTAELDRIALMPEPPAYEYCRLGSTWMEIPNYPVAETALLRGLQRDPYSYACHLELGELYRRTERLPLARKYFEWVVRFFPDTDPSVFRQLAAVDVLLGDNGSARSALEKGHRIFPHDGPIQRAQKVLGG